NAEVWGGQPLARFRLWDRDNVLLTQGYLGLYPTGDGKGFGQINLDTFAPAVRTWVSADCYLRLDPQAPHPLTPADRGALDASLRAPRHPGRPGGLPAVPRGATGDGARGPRLPGR